MRRLFMLRPASMKPGKWFLALVLVIGLATGLSLVLTPAPQVHAASTFSVESIGGSIGLGSADLKTTVINILKWVLGALTLVALVYLIYGGFLWLTAAGDERRIEKAKQVILQALIGMVIVLLAWAIVIFVAGGISNILGQSSGGNNGPPCTANCLPSGNSTLDITAITSCAEPPNFADNVPRSSNISLTFNRDLDIQSVKDAVTQGTANPHLIIEKCADPTCSTLAAPATPHPINNQVFSGSAPVGAKGSTLAEWVAKDNTITFYHNSFSTDENNPDNMYFEKSTTYRVTIPKDQATYPIKDITSPVARILQHCQQQNLVQIPGDHCTESGNNIYWVFQVGNDTAGKPLDPQSTVPSSDYITNLNSVPDQNVDRSAVLGINFNGGIDPQSVSTTNFQVFKFTTPPTTGQHWTDGTPAGLPLDPNDFTIAVNSGGTGAWLQLKPGKLFEPFTWYQVKVKDFRNLCGTTQTTNPYVWVFETNDTAPGVVQVYPGNENNTACPTTKVFIQFATSMYQVGNGDCENQQYGGGSFVRDGGMLVDGKPVAGRQLHVVDPIVDSNNPNNYCKLYEFTPDTFALTPGKTYSVGVNTDKVINMNGDKLSWGDKPPADQYSQNAWHFTVAPPATCVQAPVITQVSPDHGANGQCVSVIGSYFTKQPPYNDNQSKPEPGDRLELGSVDQKPSVKSWTDNGVVGSVVAGSLPTGQKHSYRLTVDYPAPIGPVTSAPFDFQLDSGTAGQGPCLVSLNPNSGPVGTTLNAQGENFGSTQGDVFVSTIPSPWWAVGPGTWHDTHIDSITVNNATPVSPPISLVQIRDSNNQLSNSLPFTVTPAPPGNVTVPQIVQDATCNLQQNIIPSPTPQPNDTQACLNSSIAARFNVPMKASTLVDGNFKFEDCSGSCVPVAHSFAAVGTQEFLITPNAKLKPSTPYRVTVTTNLQSQAGVAMASDYVWNFTTKAGTADCQPTNIAILPGNTSFQSQPFSLAMKAVATTASCQTLAGGFACAWASTLKTVADVTGSLTENETAFSPSAGAVAGTTDISAKCENITGHLSLTYNPNSVSCQTNADCSKNSYGESCPGSVCLNNACTPVLNKLVPNNGAAGTYTTLEGCWFGGYVANQSKVTFTSNVDSAFPNQAACAAPGSLWSNNRIIQESPVAATTGPVVVTRSDSQKTDPNAVGTNPNFTVNATQYPGICNIFPSQEFPGDGFTVSGDRFGSKIAGDSISLTKILGPTWPVSDVAGTWKNTTIDAIVPNVLLLGTAKYLSHTLAKPRTPIHS